MSSHHQPQQSIHSHTEIHPRLLAVLFLARDCDAVKDGFPCGAWEPDNIYILSSYEIRLSPAKYFLFKRQGQHDLMIVILIFCSFRNLIGIFIAQINSIPLPE